MLLKRAVLRRIADGEVTLAFRRWRRPTVKAGGTLLTPIGQLAIDSVDAVEATDITESDARAAGFDGIEELRDALAATREGTIYRVALRVAGPDPRVALRATPPRDRKEIEAMRNRLERYDRASDAGWTRAVLDIIAERPGERAADLAAAIGVDRAIFKARVRKLKALGLTESLKTGYRISPRGEAFLRREES